LVHAAEEERMELSGTFWLAGAPGPRRSGVLTAEPGRGPSLVVQGALTAMMRRRPESGAPQDTGATGTDGETAYLFEPTEDFSSRTVHGVADDGTAVTLLEAQNRRYYGFLPDGQVETLVGTHAVTGAHLTGREHVFIAVRARVQGARALLAADGHGQDTRLTDAAALTVERDHDGTWIVLGAIPPASVRLIDRTYLRPAASLLSLAAGATPGCSRCRSAPPGTTAGGAPFTAPRTAPATCPPTARPCSTPGT
jgi:hypothetical protein